MKIINEHMIHGAVLAQIAEDEQFTAINVVTHHGEKSRSAYRVNDTIGIFLKYCGKPRGESGELTSAEYAFNFTQDHIDELATLNGATDPCFAVLICVQDREICAVPYADLMDLIGRRIAAVGHAEDQYVLTVTVTMHKSYRVCIKAPGTKGKALGKELIVPRTRFPRCLFEG